MQRGQIAVVGVFIALIFGTIGLVIVNDLSSTMTTPVTVVNESLGVVTNNTVDTFANTCPVAITSIYDWTTTADVPATNYTLYPATQPNKATQTITWTANSSEFVAHGSVVGVNYTYGCNYADSSLLRTVISNIPILFAVGVLVLAVGWVALR